ncbi:leucine-rich repeat-containing protein 28 [Anabrus simplex]|uniref:leucine-rich repeat-containing protein 28 n=1 Tax=Anabrus simplex TaxID=316456 RepID=UPI0035A363A7
MMDPDMAREVQTKVILHWNYRGFKELPEELRIEGEHVKEVYLKWNVLDKLPQWLGVLRSLTNLYLYGNMLESLPKEIEELHSLVILDVSENHLSSLPENICKLHYLSVLIATNNKLSSLPKDIQKLTSLQTLHLAGNSLQILPESLCQCQSLEDLCLDRNNLLCLPSQIVYLPRLNSLSVSGNQLIYLPALPFTTEIHLNFNENPCLNYLPFPLGCQITSRNGSNADHWYLNCFGCFLRSLSDSTYLKNTILHVPPSSMWQNEAMQLVMPYELNHVYMPGSAQVPSLYEMTLRTVYTSLYHHIPQNIKLTRKHIFTTFRKLKFEWERYQIFPSSIAEQLRRGPVTICFHPNCQAPIFKYAVVWVVPVNNLTRSGQEISVLTVVYFCSQNCSLLYEKYELSNLNESEVLLSQSRTEWKYVQTL